MKQGQSLEESVPELFRLAATLCRGNACEPLEPERCAEVLDAAEEWGLTPFVWPPLARACGEAGLLQQGYAEYKQRATQSNLRCLALARESLAVAEGLRKTGVPALPFKGPRLTQRLFGDTVHRRHADMDILVQPAALPRAIRRLGEMGYVADFADPASPILRHDGQIAFLDSRPLNFMLELHWRLYPRSLPFPRRLGLDALWPRLQANGMDFTDEDLALYLCFHWIKEWAWIDKLLLFAAALDRCVAFPWNSVLQEAEQEGTLRMLLLGCLMAQVCFDAQVPVKVLDRAESDAKTRSLARRVLGRLEDDAGPLSQWTMFHFSWDLLMRPSDKARFFWLNLCQPTLAEYRAWPLPTRWQWLYYLIRPFRLVWKHTLGRLTRQQM